MSDTPQINTSDRLDEYDNMRKEIARLRVEVDELKSKLLPIEQAHAIKRNAERYEWMSRCGLTGSNSY